MLTLSPLPVAVVLFLCLSYAPNLASQGLDSPLALWLAW